MYKRTILFSKTYILISYVSVYWSNMAIDVIQTQENKFRINSANFIEKLISFVGEIHSNLLQYSWFMQRK